MITPLQLKNLSEVRVLKNAEIDSRISNCFYQCFVAKVGSVVIFSGYMKETVIRNINIAGTLLFKLPFIPISEVWVEPAFTIKPNGNFEVGTHISYNSNKINEPRHINFVYVCQN